MTLRAHGVKVCGWLGLGALVGVVSGGASALFLTLLDRVTTWRVAHETVVYALPLAGWVMGVVYQRFGAPTAAGTNLILDTLHEGGPQIPLRMAPMVLWGTLSSHLFGASVGREGTAIQMGASLADGLAHRFKSSPEVRTQWLVAGVAGGFGSVFGTPLAGTVFALEFVVLGRLRYDALVPALCAALVGDFTSQALGVEHTTYVSIPWVPLTPGLALRWLVFAGVVALVSGLFVELSSLLKKQADARLPRLPLRMFVGGAVLVVLWKVVGTGDYLGLGIPTLTRAFSDPDLPVYAFALKLLFTAVSVSAGFPGGEVTPLFFVGAALGSVAAKVMGVPLELGAGVGMAAVFAAAANAPLALSLMAVELMGAAVLPHVALVAVMAYFLSGHRGIYPAQRMFHLKSGTELPRVTTLKAHRQQRRP